MMRGFKNLILTLAISFIALNATAEDSVFNWTKVMDAIIQVESKGNPKAYNKRSNCVGILQITPTLVKECNNILKRKRSAKRYTLKDRWDAEKSKEMFVIFQEEHNPSHDVEKAIRMWNGGPNYSKGKTNIYLRKVMKWYENKGSD